MEKKKKKLTLGCLHIYKVSMLSQHQLRQT